MRIFDLHNDIITSKQSYGDILQYFLQAKQDKIEIIYAIWTSELSITELIAKADFLMSCGAAIAVEDCGIIADNPDILLRYAPKYCTITWNHDNPLAGGAHGAGELTASGRDFIGVLNANKIAVDLSHLNRRSFFQVIERGEKVLASHSCPNEFKLHNRNLSHDQISLIIERKGIIGLAFVPEFIKDNANIFDVVQMIDRFVQRYGINNLSIGTDFFGVKTPVKSLESYVDFHCLKTVLQDYGYSKSALERLFYATAKDFF